MLKHTDHIKAIELCFTSFIKKGSFCITSGSIQNKQCPLVSLSIITLKVKWDFVVGFEFGLPTLQSVDQEPQTPEKEFSVAGQACQHPKNFG